MADPREIIRSGDGLLVVDVQNDFCPGGALPIEEGDKIIPVLNYWLAVARDRMIPIYVSRDWHPAGHVSFEKEGGSWPPHCLQDSLGAEFHPKLTLVGDEVIITKGVRFDQDQNSVFDQTGLAHRLRKDGVERLLVGGLAEDVCVLASVLDARREGLTVTVIGAATRPVTAEGGKEAMKKMKEAGAEILTE
jgi:nicotinamidase/pyrazinamidase